MASAAPFACLRSNAAGLRLLPCHGCGCAGPVGLLWCVSLIAYACPKRKRPRRAFAHSGSFGFEGYRTRGLVYGQSIFDVLQQPAIRRPNAPIVGNTRNDLA